MSPTDSILVELLKRAEEIVIKAEVSEDLRPTAFAKVFDSLGSPTRSEEETPPTGTGSDPERAESSEQQSKLDSHKDFLGRIATKLQVSRESVDDVFYDDSGDLGISIASSRLAPSSKGGAKQLSLLVAAGRQAAGVDDQWTRSEKLREVCQFYGKFDVGNYGKTLAGMDDVFQFKGKGLNREVRVKQPGFEQAGELIELLTSTS
jgi:hypothetical protein